MRPGSSEVLDGGEDRSRLYGRRSGLRWAVAILLAFAAWIAAGQTPHVEPAAVRRRVEPRNTPTVINAVLLRRSDFGDRNLGELGEKMALGARSG